jgi:hypothetical protein
MFVFTGVFFALFATNIASEGAGLQRRTSELFIGARPPRRQGACRDAQVCAVQIDAYALAQLCDVGFTHARVGANNADNGAVVTFLDA